MFFYRLITLTLLMVPLFLRAEMGFYTPQERSFPAPILEARKSIFMLYFMREKDAINPATYVDLPKHQYSAAHAAFEKKFLDKNVKENHFYGISYSQLRRCMEEQRSVCRILHYLPPTSLSTCTAFLYQEQEVLATAGHCLNDWARHDRLILVNYQFKVIFDSVEDGRYEVTRHGSSLSWPSLYQRLLRMTGGLLSANSINDFALLTLEQKLPYPALRPVNADEASKTMGQTHYALGYPALTQNRRAEFNVPDSDGQGLKITFGQQSSIKDFFEKKYSSAERDEMFTERLKGIALDDFFKVHDEFLISFPSMDATPGMSGAPILNEEGQVKGILVKGMADFKSMRAEDVFIPHYSVGSKIENLDRK